MVLSTYMFYKNLNQNITWKKYLLSICKLIFGVNYIVLSFFLFASVTSVLTCLYISMARVYSDYVTDVWDLQFNASLTRLSFK